MNLNDILTEKNWEKAVIKPAVSGGAYKTSLISKNEAGNQETFEALIKENDVLIQKFIDEIKDGEWSLIFFNKKYSHSALKVPKADDFRVQHEFGGKYIYKEAPAGSIQQAQKIVESVKDELLYARVDGIFINNVFYLMELELIEPDLFLDGADAKENFMKAILEALK